MAAATPHIQDPKPLADSLVRLMTDQPTTTSVLAVAVRAALFTCAEEQQVALDCLTRTDDLLTRALLVGRIETANRVVRRVSDTLGQLDDLP
jgi:hypothetical protein